MGLRSAAASILTRAAQAISVRASDPAYDAAGQGRRTGHWQPSSAAINAILFASADTLRSRSRDMVRKNPWAQHGVQSFAASAIGTGIVPQSLHPDPAMRKAIRLLWDRFAEQSDAHGITDIYGQQRLAVVAVKEAAECFARLRPRLPEDGLAVPLQVQLIEAEHVPMQHTLPLGNGMRIRGGIEFDALGRRRFYHMYREHPGDASVSGDINDLIRVPASEVLHVFEPLRPGQVRGVPGLSTALLRLFEFDQYEDGELVRKRDASMFSGFIKETAAQSGAGYGGETEGKDDGGIVDVVKLEPGTWQKLRPGEDVTRAEAADMGEGYSDFMRWVLRAIAAAIGITYEQLTGDLTGVNYSSIRAGLIEFRRAMEHFQHSIVVHQFCRPIWFAFLDAAVLSGALPVSARDYRANLALFRSVKWVPPGWAWVDPEKEVKAAIMAIRGGLSSRSTEVSATGYSAEQVDAEQAADNARADGLGLSYVSDGRRPMDSYTAAWLAQPTLDDGEQDRQSDRNAA